MNISPKLKSLGNNLILAAILIAIGYLSSTAMGLGRTGFDQQSILQQYTFYLNGGLFLLGLLSFYIASLVTSDEKYGSSVAFNSPGEAPAIESNFFKNPFRLVLFSIALFSILGIISTSSNTVFTGVGQLAQQFTVTDNIIFSSLLVPVAENLGLAFFIAIIIFLTRVLARKNNWSKTNFIVFTAITTIITSSAYGVVNHLLRYQGQEVAIAYVAFFWAFGGLITILTGSFIPFWIMHISNNLFFMLRQSFSSEYAMIFAVSLTIASFILFALTLFRKKPQENFVEAIKK